MAWGGGVAAGNGDPLRAGGGGHRAAMGGPTFGHLLLLVTGVGAVLR